MPEMDEGGFTLDYWTPAGSSLAETNRMVSRMEQILSATPEVESTSRRTGLELGLAAVTEANRGDILVKLKKDRSRAIDDVIEDVRAKVTAQEPAVRVEFVQVLQDMIGDLDQRTGTCPDQIVFAGPGAAGSLGAKGRRGHRQRSMA